VKLVDRKAVRLVTSEHVHVDTATFNGDGQLVTATGTVEGDTGLWTVTIQPGATTCDCPYGEARVDAAGHSHDLALRLAAQRQETT